MIKHIWRLNGFIFSLSIIIFFIGILALPSLINGFSPHQTYAEKHNIIIPTKKSNLVQLALNFSKRFEARTISPPNSPIVNPPIPEIIKSPPTSEPVIIIKPPEPPTNIEKIIPPPSFILQATFMIGNIDKQAWIQTSRKQKRLYHEGQKIGNYSIHTIKHGEITVEREGKTFTLNIPKNII